MKKNNKIKTLSIVIMMIVLVSHAGFGCRDDVSESRKTIHYLFNEHFHFHSIPRPCKRVEIHTNGSNAIRKVMVTLPSGADKPLEGDLAVYSFTPDTPGHYRVKYEYAFTNHFEHLFPEKPDSVKWESSEFQFQVENYPIPTHYKSISSVNQHITLFYPEKTDSKTVDLVLEVKPFSTPSKLEIQIPDFANFPEAFSFTGPETVSIHFPQDRQYCTNGMQFILFDSQNRENTQDSLSFQQEIRLEPKKQTILQLNDAKPDEYLQKSVYFLEEGVLQIWNFQLNQVNVLANDQDYRHFALSPNHKQIALSTLNDTYLCDYNGSDLKKIAPGYHKPVFLNDHLVLLVGAYQWPEGKEATYGNIRIQNNVYRMPVGIFDLSLQDFVLQSEVQVYLGDRWSMYFPTFESLPVDIIPFEKTSGEYLLKVNSPGLQPKWVMLTQSGSYDYDQENTPWIPESPFLYREFMFEGDIQEAILKKTTHSNQNDLLFVEKGYAILNLPEEKNRYLTFVRTVRDIVSAPSFYIETHQELCVLDYVTKKIFTLPSRAITVSHLGG